MKKARKLPNGWIEFRIKDKFQTGSGATPLSTKKEFYENGNIPWINSGELESPYINSTSNFITQLGFESSNTHLFAKNTVLLAMYGATAGKASLLEIEACTNQAICAIKPNDDFSSLFIKYQLDNLYDYLVSLSSGSARNNLSQEGIGNLTLFAPKTKDEQEHLIRILRYIDSKIENNNKINAELESLAKTIYDYWFLQFEFPNEEGKPYKSSGGKMVWNKELKREIPDGWAVKKLNSIANLYQPEILPSNLMKEDGKYFVYGANGIVGRYNKFNHEHPEIAICCRGASCGNYLMTLPKSWITGNSMVVTPKDSSVTKEYLYHSLRYIDIKRYVTGSAQPQITRSNLDGIKVVIPPFKSLEHFSNKAEKIRNELIKNINENNELSSLRDFLLPMLMNGQVQFK